jgi:hypothetical protein
MVVVFFADDLRRLRLWLFFFGEHQDGDHAAISGSFSDALAVGLSACLRLEDEAVDVLERRAPAFDLDLAVGRDDVATRLRRGLGSFEDAQAVDARDGEDARCAVVSELERELRASRDSM